MQSKGLLYVIEPIFEWTNRVLYLPLLFDKINKNVFAFQGTTIQSQLQSLRDREKAIENFEQKVHLLRMKVNTLIA